MTRVGVRELKQNASSVIRRVRAGETVEVTDRGVPVALIVPVPEAADVVERLVLVDLDTELLRAAALLDPPEIRSVDAVHLAAARALAPALAAFVAYDARLADAAAALGLPVEAPG